jgi:hypothetical protein
MYRAPSGYDDQLGHSLRSPDFLHKGAVEDDETRSDCVTTIVLVDSFHYYESLFRELTDAFGVLVRRSIVVMTVFLGRW